MQSYLPVSDGAASGATAVGKPTYWQCTAAVVQGDPAYVSVTYPGYFEVGVGADYADGSCYLEARVNVLEWVLPATTLFTLGVYEASVLTGSVSVAGPPPSGNSAVAWYRMTLPVKLVGGSDMKVRFTPASGVGECRVSYVEVVANTMRSGLTPMSTRPTSEADSENVQVCSRTGYLCPASDVAYIDGGRPVSVRLGNPPPDGGRT